MSRFRILTTTIVLVLASVAPVLATTAGRLAAEGVAPDAGLVDALAHVPDIPAAREQPLSYVDYRAVEKARLGAAQPTSFAELESLRDSDDPSARLWTAAYQGIASGSGDLLRSLFVGGSQWPTLLGFDFFDVDRELAFGVPPTDGLVLMGRFDPAAIATAFAARGYTATAVGDQTLLCGPDGCDSGMELHIDQRNPANPLGGDLGRLQPLLASSTALGSSASGETVRAMLDANLQAPTLGTDPAYRAAAEAVSSGTTLQATIVPGSEVSADVAGMLLQGGDAAKAELEQLASTFQPIPAYELLAFGDGAAVAHQDMRLGGYIEAEQVVRIALVYQDPDDARQAVNAIPGRLSLLSLVTRKPVEQLLKEHGLTGFTGATVTSSDGSRTVAIITLTAPLAPAQPDATTGLLTSSSSIYRLLVNMLLTRDLLWLAPTLPTIN